MLPPLIRRPQRSAVKRPRERGVTMALVALAIFSIIAMAALSIDIGTLYQASAEAQRSADAAALAAARVLSLSGMTGDPTNKSGQWSAACAAATLAAQAVGSQNTVAGAAPTVPTPTYVAADGKSDCTAGSGTAVSFGVNPTVTVKVMQSNLPTYFSRIWGSAGSSVSATATAEVFNPSNSGSFASGGEMVPVQPHCVKPWIVPNRDPGNTTCGGSPCQFVSTTAGATAGTIQNGGIIVGGSGTGVIGETFNLAADCGGTGNCNSVTAGPPAPYFVSPPSANGANVTAATPNLEYLPGEVLGAPKAAPSCAAGAYQQAIAGCDQTTPYQCGVQAASLGASANLVDLAENPGGPTGDTATAAGAGCLTRSGDSLNTLNPSAYPYQIIAGGLNPTGVSSRSVITSSNSIVSFPIYDDTQLLMINGSNQAPVTIVGFLQVFINPVANADGSLNVTVLNVAGCGESVPNNATYINGTSPVPVRLITPP